MKDSWAYLPPTFTWFL